MRRTLSISIFLLTALTVWLFVFSRWQLPQTISDFGQVFDSQFKLTMIVIGVAFIVFQVLLGLIVWRKSQTSTGAKENLKVEIAWTLFTTTIFLTLAFLGQRVWFALLKPQNKNDVVKIVVIAQQFQWNFHYAGRDKIFGQTKPRLINDAELNYIGLDKADANAKDDIISSVLVVPVNQTVELTMKSRDVTHSFWVAPLRFKQDLVPGLTTKIVFRPTQMGKYEIACAELCGISHYKMKSYLLIVSEEEHQQLMLLSQEDFQTKVSGLLNQNY
jgi:cytochrome c oxidase subunit 2